MTVTMAEQIGTGAFVSQDLFGGHLHGKQRLKSRPKAPKQSEAGIGAIPSSYGGLLMGAEGPSPQVRALNGRIK